MFDYIQIDLTMRMYGVLLYLYRSIFINLIDLKEIDYSLILCRMDRSFFGFIQLVDLFLCSH